MTTEAKHYYLYIDDSGSRFPDKQESLRNDRMDYFALGGILIEEKDKQILQKKYLEFCKKWDITYPLHSNEIRGMRDNFVWLEKNGSKNKENFLNDLEEFLVSIPVIGFAAVIHRPGYNSRYKEKYGDKRWLMCKTAYTVLVERVAKYVSAQGGTFEVRFEEVGKKEDYSLLEYAKEMKAKGHPFNPTTAQKYAPLGCDDYKKVIIGDPCRKKKTNLYIQIADLYLYPMVKRKYDPLYRPWSVFFERRTVIDAHIPKEEYEFLGIKYSCFDDTESKRT